MKSSAFPHGGDVRGLARSLGVDPGDILDFSASINPLGPPDWLRNVLSANVSDLVHYPDPHCREFREAAAARYKVPAARLTAGNGVSELLTALARAVPQRRAVVPVPSYADYRKACERAGLTVTLLPLRADRDFALDPTDLDALLAEPAVVFLGRPNNPTGLDVPAGVVLDLARSHPDCLFVADEAFGGFVEGFESLIRQARGNVAVLISLTKLYAIPGLRLGLLAASEDLCRATAGHQPDWSVNSLAQAVGVAAMRDRAFARRSRAAATRLRRALVRDLAALPGLTVLPGQANYLLCRLDRPEAAKVAAFLHADRIAVRLCANFPGLDDRYFRVAVRSGEDNARLARALARVLAPGARPVRARRATPALMVQGTSSNAGKSVLAAALCRILRQDGVRVAPFKAQNMSLNSFVTAWGEEMGRAQVLQAQAAGLAPQARMNPVLLKPNSDTGSQVIVMGRPVGTMRVAEYLAYKPRAFRAARTAYDSLARDFQAVILEGAGSPAEVNLKAHDLVNMAMARHARAKVLLVGDIDRGGVFAALAGTMALLSESERALVGGYVLNRFRGDPRLLDPALECMLSLTGRKVLGVVPEIRDLGLPEEDSVSFKAGGLPGRAGRDLDIAVIDLAHISNFTDFDALAAEPDVSLRVVRAGRDLGRPDALVLPGSKNTLADLAALREHGLDTAIRALAQARAAEVVGVCAGYQMLGRTLRDPLGLESDRALEPGLDLLPLDTELEGGKTLRQTRAVHQPTGLALAGYEIHHGTTGPVEPGLPPLITGLDGRPLGYGEPGRVWGSYLHGVFDAPEFRRWWLDALRARKGLPPLADRPGQDLDAALDRLADVVRASLDMGAVYALLGL